jgi:hypothetical protein
MKPVHDQLTVVSIVGHCDGATAIPAIHHSIGQLPGSRGLLLSPSRPTGLPLGVHWKPIAPLTYQQYSIFMMHCLHHFIETDFCLVVQDDGWVLDGMNFRKDYYAFDYIGAPCHAAFIGQEYLTGFRWVGRQSATVIQNGGFSLRSRRFLEAPSTHGIMYLPHVQPPLINEDIQLTGILRGELEKHGIQFAPLGVAREFAIEYLAPVFHDDLDFGRLLGHHARTRRLVADRSIEVPMAAEQLGHVFREAEFMHYLQDSGYAIRYQART